MKWYKRVNFINTEYFLVSALALVTGISAFCLPLNKKSAFGKTNVFNIRCRYFSPDTPFSKPFVNKFSFMQFLLFVLNFFFLFYTKSTSLGCPFFFSYITKAIPYHVKRQIHGLSSAVKNFNGIF